jgi:hypothetical protein
MTSINSIDLIDVGLQSAVTYEYIGTRMHLFGLDPTKSFIIKQNLKPYSDSICSRKTG